MRTQKVGQAATMYIHGLIIVGPAISDLRNAVLSQTNVKTVILDLQQVSVVDAAGLGTLVDLRQVLRLRGTSLTLVNPTTLVRRLFAITRLDSVFNMTSRDSNSAAKTFAASE